MLMYILGAIAVLLATTFIVVRVVRGGIMGVYTKTIASIAFVTLGIFGAYTNGLTLVSVFMILGLIFGLLGDIVLDLKVVYKEHNNPHLNAGVLCFGVGHIMYFIALTLYITNTAFITNAKIMPILLIATAIGLILTIGIMTFCAPMLKLDFGKFKIQTALYTFALTFMTAYAFTSAIYLPKLFIFAVGLLVFFISDLVLSNQYFGGKQNSKLLTIVNHATYYLGQITIAVMIYFL